MKSTSKLKEKKKSSTKPLDFCFYCISPGHIEDKYYYMYLECVSKDFGQNFPAQIIEL